ncbi:glycosyltransferase, partial [Arsenicitalea aurantiaca]
MVALPEWVSALMPSLLLAGIWIAIVPSLKVTSRVARLTLFAFGVFFSVRYLGWRFTETLAPLGWTWDALASWSFALIEGISVVSSLSAFVILSRHRDRTPEADANLHWFGDSPPSIAVLIATYNEEWPVLERTIAGALACDWPNKRIYVLDDGRRDWLGDRCREMGVIHVTRPD